MQGVGEGVWGRGQGPCPWPPPKSYFSLSPIPSTAGPRLHGAHDQAPEAAVFQDMEAGDGGAARGGHQVFQDPRVHFLFQAEAGGADDGLGGQQQGQVPGQAHLDAAVGQGLDEHGDVGRAAAAQAGDRVQEPFFHHHGPAHGAQRSPGPGPRLPGWRRLPGARAAIPAPTRVGVLGMIRITRDSGKAASRVFRVTPAAMEMIRCPGPAYSLIPDSRTAVMIWGLTARTTTGACITSGSVQGGLHPQLIQLGLPGRVRVIIDQVFPGNQPPASSPRMMAPPMLPAPMNPSFIAVRRPSPASVIDIDAISRHSFRYKLLCHICPHDCMEKVVYAALAHGLVGRRAIRGN